MTARGYLLLEAMIGGALLAAAIGVAFAIVAHGRGTLSTGANRAAAAALLRAKADELASGACAGASSGPVGAGYEGFSWSWSVAPDAAAEAASTPPLTSNTLCRAEVHVSFPVRRGAREDLSDGVANNGVGEITATRHWDQ